MNQEGSQDKIIRIDETLVKREEPFALYRFFGNPNGNPGKQRWEMPA